MSEEGRPPAAPEVIVACGDAPFSEAVARELGALTLSATIRTSILALLSELRARRAAAAIVDLDLAAGEPWSLLRAVREARGPGPLVLVAVSGIFTRPRDMIEGLRLGAADFAAKSLDPRVLASRVRALLVALERRRRGPGPTELRAADGALRLDLPGHRCLVERSGGGGGGLREVKLSPLEFRILRDLLARPGTLVTREELLRSLWPDDPDRRHLSTLAQLMARLRRKLGAAGAQITTVWGLGYRVRPAARD